jgi:kynureninase
MEIITPKFRKARGCQLSLRMRNTLPEIMDKLHQNGILADWREPDVIRVAPVPLYNSFEDCYQFVERMKKIVRG